MSTRDAEFDEERRLHQQSLGQDSGISKLGLELVEQVNRHKYSYNFDWCGLPIIQHPEDIVAVQELLWRVAPRAVVETGVARGGSLLLSASMLELIGDDGIVIGVDIDIRSHNRRAIEEHRLSRRISLVEGSSTDAAVVAKVHDAVGGRAPVIVFLDSLHTHDHVLAELHAYNDLVGPGSYIVVFDTIVEDLPDDHYADRPWAPGNSPKSAVREFLERPGCRFELDEEYDAKLVMSNSPGGYLRCVR